MNDINKNPIYIYDNCWLIDDEPGTLCVGAFTDATEIISLQRLFNSLEVGIYAVDENDKFIFINDKGAEILGYDRKDILKMNLRNIYFNPEDMEKFKIKLEKDEILKNIILKMKKKNNDVVYLNVSSIRAKKNAEGKMISREGIFFDISKRMAITETIQDLPIGYYKIINDENGRDLIVDCNKEFVSNFGYNSDKEIIGKLSATEHIHASPEETNKLFDKLKENQGTVKDFRLMVKDKSENTFIIELDTKYIVDENNEPIGREGVFKNVQKKVEMERQITDVKTFIHRLSTPFYNMRIDFQLFKKYLDEILKENVMSDEIQIITEEDINKLFAKIKETKDFIEDYQLKMKFKEKVEKLHNLRKQRKKADNMTIKNECANQIFLTAKEEFSKLLIFYKRRKAELKDDFNARELLMFEAAGENIKEIEKIAYSKKIVIAYKLLEKLKSENEHGSLVIETYNRYLDRDAFITDFEYYDLIEIVREVINLYQGKASQRKLSIDLNIREDRIDVYCIRHEVKIMISNIIDNAIKYSYELRDGYISVTIRENKSKDSCIIKISNYGRGLSDEELSHVWDLNYRGENANYFNIMGSGIGLWEVAYIVDMHNGEKKIDSKPVAKWIASMEEKFSDKEKMRKLAPHITTVTIELPKYKIIYGGN